MSNNRLNLENQEEKIRLLEEKLKEKEEQIREQEKKIGCLRDEMVMLKKQNMQMAISGGSEVCKAAFLMCRKEYSCLTSGKINTKILIGE